MTDQDVQNSGQSQDSAEFEKEDIDRAARDIIIIEKNCFYGDEPERDRLKKIREKLLNIVSDR